MSGLLSHISIIRQMAVNKTPKHTITTVSVTSSNRRTFPRKKKSLFKNDGDATKSSIKNNKSKYYKNYRLHANTARRLIKPFSHIKN
jgi:hypothetical protein